MGNRLAAIGDAIPAEWRERWRIAVSVTCATGLGYTVWPSVASLFVEPLQQASGWSRAQIALSYYAALVGGLLAPAIGLLVDRLGARVVLLSGLAMVAICYGLLATLPGALFLHYLIWVAWR